MAEKYNMLTLKHDPIMGSKYEVMMIHDVDEDDVITNESCDTAIKLGITKVEVSDNKD